MKLRHFMQRSRCSTGRSITWQRESWLLKRTLKIRPSVQEHEQEQQIHGGVDLRAQEVVEMVVIHGPTHEVKMTLSTTVRMLIRGGPMELPQAAIHMARSEQCQDTVQQVRQAHTGSPFARRKPGWPRSIPVDFRRSSMTLLSR